MIRGLIRHDPGELPAEVTGFVGRQRELAVLDGLHDPDLLPHTVATCLGLPRQEIGSQADAIVDYLRGRQLLLILDFVGAACCLEALAMLALRQQRCERTAWLMGAADTL